MGVSISSSLRKTQPQKNGNLNWIHFTRRPFLLPPYKPFQPYGYREKQGVHVCVCRERQYTAYSVHLWPFLHTVSPTVRTTTWQRGHFTLGVKKARLLINQSFYKLKCISQASSGKSLKFTPIKVNDKDKDAGICCGSKILRMKIKSTFKLSSLVMA